MNRFEDIESTDLTFRIDTNPTAGGGLAPRHCTLVYDFASASYNFTMRDPVTPPAPGQPYDRIPELTVPGISGGHVSMCDTGRPAGLWDLHLGARLRVLGRQVVLKNSDLATAQWHSGYFRQLCVLRDKLHQEVQKYKPRVLRPGLVADKGDVRLQTGQQLRHVALQVRELVEDLRQYRPRKDMLWGLVSRRRKRYGATKISYGSENSVDDAARKKRYPAVSRQLASAAEIGKSRREQDLSIRIATSIRNTGQATHNTMNGIRIAVSSTDAVPVGCLNKTSYSQAASHEERNKGRRAKRKASGNVRECKPDAFGSNLTVKGTMAICLKSFLDIFFLSFRFVLTMSTSYGPLLPFILLFKLFCTLAFLPLFLFLLPVLIPWWIAKSAFRTLTCILLLPFAPILFPLKVLRWIL
ncbi:hypothetical protein VOLCADRAFT_92748 [Volvox carteri f. nagariensis]|uniref:Uncharacterized protein n=1 Tax=Volvox carteri f. nagariensis TaxID=3068 RepID=D8U0F2_VOLCA|nr:uncharacterized protein VOLCADRAFT_92748 [Volvox carteri f. nagariensis]EFJ46934.1 hypothetical protein VOLCADRAFT_92748 [Volvox carteri f. nagariensis]|eukprot:XP_002952143.1 hypothetical protein VOLCADRAFT_92748 [Volvox carteri f. nagariensis]